MQRQEDREEPPALSTQTPTLASPSVSRKNAEQSIQSFCRTARDNIKREEREGIDWDMSDWDRSIDSRPVGRVIRPNKDTLSVGLALHHI